MPLIQPCFCTWHLVWFLDKMLSPHKILSRMQQDHGTFWQRNRARSLRMRDKRVCPPDKDGGQMRNHGDVSEFSPYLRKRNRAQFCCRTYLALYDPKKQVRAKWNCLRHVNASAVFHVPVSPFGFKDSYLDCFFLPVFEKIPPPTMGLAFRQFG